MHPCPKEWVAFGRMVLEYAQAAHTFRAGFKCWHCSSNDNDWLKPKNVLMIVKCRSHLNQHSENMLHRMENKVHVHV